MPRRVPALLSDLGSDTQCPTPSPSELLTARAVQQLHDPQAVVQQSFGPHWLQASWGTQEGQHCFHLGAHLHTLKGRKPLGPQVPPPACEEIPGELWGAGWWWLSCLEEGQEIPVTRMPESNFSPSCRCHFSWEGLPRCPSLKHNTQKLLFSSPRGRPDREEVGASLLF